MLCRPDSRSSSNEALPELPGSSIQALEHEDSRLRGAVYFGYGLMNIIVSLIPPKLMKLPNLFGFHGTRKVGLQALEFSSHSQDIKAPLARYEPFSLPHWVTLSTTIFTICCNFLLSAFSPKCVSEC